MLEAFGNYQLIERLEVGSTTETFFAVGPGFDGERDPVRLTRVTSAGAFPEVARLLTLASPFERTFFVGEISGRRAQVREAAFGISLRDLARTEHGLPSRVAVSCALELCRALEQWTAPAAIPGIDERALRIG